MDLRRDRSARRRGFTVMELLVTICLMTVLVTILLPALQRSELARRRTECVADQKNNGMTAWTYLVSHQNRFPPFYISRALGDGRIVVLVTPPPARAIGFNAFFCADLVCPSDEKPGCMELKQPDGTSAEKPISLGYNIEFTANGYRYDALVSPSSRAVMYDGILYGNGNGTVAGAGNGLQGSYADAFAFAAAVQVKRHERKLNVLFADFHAGTVPELTPEMILNK